MCRRRDKRSSKRADLIHEKVGNVDTFILRPINTELFAKKYQGQSRFRIFVPDPDPIYALAVD